MLASAWAGAGGVVCCWQSGRLCAKPKLSENAFFGKRGIFSVFFIYLNAK